MTEPQPSKPNVGQPAQRARIASSVGDIGEEAWQACVDHPERPANPFVSYAFFDALELANCVGPTETGWLPQHVALENDAAEVIGVAPTYVKLHSRGEYVFDHAWADAAHRAGLSYYPKLQVAVPFTPVPGPRLLVRPDQNETKIQTLLASALVSLAERVEASSAHVTFLDHATWEHLGTLGFLKRLDQQFHWHNEDYTKFDDFLAALASRKRKTIRKERRQAHEAGLKFRTLQGEEIQSSDWDIFYTFYLDTSARKWGEPYLNRDFFQCLGEAIADTCVLILAYDDDTPIAGALHLIGDDCLYGRYWGATTYYPFLHFELCYYQAMDFAIAQGLKRVEAGAQGEHKLLRGYTPTPTYSAHWIANPDLRRAIARHLDGERRDVAQSIDVLKTFTPYRKDQ